MYINVKSWTNYIVFTLKFHTSFVINNSQFVVDGSRILLMEDQKVGIFN